MNALPADILALAKRFNIAIPQSPQPQPESQPTARLEAQPVRLESLPVSVEVVKSEPVPAKTLSAAQRRHRAVKPTSQQPKPPVSLAGGLRTRSGHAATHEQIQIVESAERLVAAGVGGALKIIAFAGAGKTSTLDLLASTALKGMVGSYLAFNSSITKAAQKSMPRNVASSSIHSLAIQTTGRRVGDFKNITTYLIKELLGNSIFKAASDAGGAAVNSQQRWFSEAIKHFCMSADQTIGDNQIDYVCNVVIGEAPAEAKDKLKESIEVRRDTARELLTEHLENAWQRMISDDRFYSFDSILKMFELDDNAVKAAFATKQFIFLDECQDLNPVMRSIAQKACKNGGKYLFAVGDPWQQIYSWNGAENALDYIIADELYLTQSFRFGSRVADIASILLRSKPEESPKKSISGNPARNTKVFEFVVGFGESYRHVNKGDTVICRSNAGLLSVALNCAINNYKICIVKGIEELVKDAESATALFEGRKYDVKVAPWTKYKDWSEAKEYYTDNDMDEKYIDDIESGSLLNDLKTIQKNIVAHESQADVILTTAHKSKGREFKKVVICADFPNDQKLYARYLAACKAKTNRSAAIKQALEEYHVKYVAFTRAIESLVILEPVTVQA